MGRAARSVRRDPPAARSGPPRRAAVLLSVLVVIAASALVASGAVYLADAQRAAATAALRRTHSRALAWSGVQVVMSRLAQQRTGLLRGAPAELPSAWVLYEQPDGTRAVVRLLPWPGGATLISEAGKLDINHAPEDMLASLEPVGPELARRIVQSRARAPFSSVEALLNLDGVDASRLYGLDDDDGTIATDADRQPRALVDLLTVFAADPTVQAGAGPRARDHTGRRRVNLNLPWSDRLARAVNDRFGEGAADIVRTLMDEGEQFRRPSDLIDVMRRRFALGPADWIEPLDALTTTHEPFAYGLVDLMSAPVEVLAAVPGIDASAAREIVRARAGLDDETRSSIAWPALLDILDPDAFQQAVDYLTSRSLVWRVRLEAGFAPPAMDRGDGMIGGVLVDPTYLTELPLRDAIIVEAVIDVGSTRPRVAYLRDMTAWSAAVGLYRQWRAAEPSDPWQSQPADLPDPESASAALAQPGGEANRPGGSGGSASEGARADNQPYEGAGAGRLGGGSASGQADGEPDPPDGVDRRVGRWQTGGGAA